MMHCSSGRLSLSNKTADSKGHLDGIMTIMKRRLDLRRRRRMSQQPEFPLVSCIIAVYQRRGVSARSDRLAARPDLSRS